MLRVRKLGRSHGVSVRTIPLKPGDTMQIEVKPERANVDHFLQTGGQEITALLQYSQPGEHGALVGGIELDYGAQESEFLPAFGRTDLTTFVVSPDIPEGQKGDDYQGTKPPPTVRFKEPFLIAYLQLKSEQDARFPSRSWIHNAPDNLYSSAGLDQQEGHSAHQ